MRITHLLRVVGLALAAGALLAPIAMKAETVISNETLVSTTFVANKKTSTAKCGTSGCRARTQMLVPISVTCPAPTGQTCTFHISLDAKVSAVLPCNCGAGQQISFYQFLVDGAAPTIGPTDKEGDYLFERSVYTYGPAQYASRQSYPASVVATVTNSKSNSHTIAVNLGCDDYYPEGGCETTAYWSTMRVDVFEP